MIVSRGLEWLPHAGHEVGALAGQPPVCGQPAPARAQLWGLARHDTQAGNRWVGLFRPPYKTTRLWVKIGTVVNGNKD